MLEFPLFDLFFKLPSFISICFHFLLPFSFLLLSCLLFIFDLCMQIFSKSIGTQVSTIFQILDAHIYKNNMFIICSITLLYFGSILVINKGSGVHFLVDFLEVPKMIQKVVQYVREPKLTILK